MGILVAHQLCDFTGLFAGASQQFHGLGHAIIRQILDKWLARLLAEHGA